MQSLNVFEKGIGYLEAVLSYYSGSCSYLMLYILCLAYIILKVDKRDKEIFGFGGLFLLLTVYNPVAPLIMDKIFDVNSEYYRFFWVAPVIILVPYVLTGLIVSAKSSKKRLYITGMVILILILSGDFIYRDGIKLAENIYKMPSELIEVSEKIHEDSKKEYTRVFLEYEYNMQMRQYDPKILLTIDREDYLYAVTNDYSDEMLNDESNLQYRIIAALIKYKDIPVEDFKEAMEATHTEYVVLDKANLFNGYVKEAGLCEIGSTKNHTIYRYPLKEPENFELVDYSVVY
ncbi:MAG: hypothetical protein K6B28_12260 [Lachnospiraceae bacterium]|nr:hypothetical protein [Lachnospiraceae bacterium]